MSTTSNVRTTDEPRITSVGWEALTKRLAKHNESAGRASLWNEKHHPLRWNLPPQAKAEVKPLLKRLRSALHGKPKASAELAKELETWLAEAGEQERDTLFAYQCLAWGYALPLLINALPAAPCHQLLEHLCDTAEEAQREAGGEKPLARQLLAGELGWSLSVLLPEVSACRELRGAARKELSSGLVDLHDGEGLLHERRLDILRPLLACWTRCLLLAQQAEKSCLSPSAMVQYEWTLTQALRLSRGDGGQVLSDGGNGKSLFTAMLRLVDDEQDRTIASRILPQGKAIAGGPTSAAVDRSPAVYSEWSELAVMRPEFKRNAPQFSVAFGEDGLRTELSVEGQLVWSGASTPQIRIDGNDIEVGSEWRELCWFSDEDVDYLEIEAELPGGWVVQRQMALTRKERLFYVADVVLGGAPSKIEYMNRLPILEEIAFRPAEETREGGLRIGKRLATVLPLALPEWRREPSPGELRNTEQGLTLSMSREGKALYAPLLFALGRHSDDLTWRRLTVAEQLEIQPADVAVAYRAQIGAKQWVIYRSLAPTGNRTYLGQNLTAEFLFGRFNRKGEVAAIVEIE